MEGPEVDGYIGQGCEEDVDMQELEVFGRGERDAWRRRIEEAKVQV